jgi:hemerythrin-like metal-binding protein
MISKWKDEYSVKDEIFDAHHKHLFDLILESEKLLIDNFNNDQLARIIKELKDYTIFHFTEEEKRMADYNYGGLEKQQEEHKKYVKEIADFETRVLSNEPFVLDDVVLFLNQWLINHIQKEDMKYRDLI